MCRAISLEDCRASEGKPVSVQMLIINVCGPLLLVLSLCDA